ncbi:MAG: DUF1697 domain-containing protein [Chloroflexota bacterium]
MNNYIALLRGINVGGHNKLPMKELATVLEKLGLADVKTYIQSGNVVFRSERTDIATLSEEITAAIGQSHGFSPQIFILRKEQLQAAIEANPYPEASEEPKTLHFFFLDATPQQFDQDALEAIKKENERFQLVDNVFYLHAPDGIARSKVAETATKGWDVSVTARNWRTVSKVMEMALANSQN